MKPNCTTCLKSRHRRAWIDIDKSSDTANTEIVPVEEPEQSHSSVSQQTPSQLTAFTGVTTDEFDIKLVKGGILPFSSGLVSNPNHPGIIVDEYGEVFTFRESGMYRFVLDMKVVEMNEEGCLRLAVSHMSNKHQCLALLPIFAVGHQHTSTTIPITKDSTVSIKQTGSTEITIKAGSCKVQIYRVG